MFFRDALPWSSWIGSFVNEWGQRQFKCQLKNVSYTYIYSYDYDKQKRILSEEEWIALNDLRNDNSIIITRRDKGNGVVIINRLDYLNKMKQLISGDDSKLRKLSHNPTRSIENSLISYLWDLKRDGIIDARLHFVKFFHVLWFNCWCFLWSS